MDVARDYAKYNKYFWFYPNSKNKIRLVLNTNSKSESKSILKKRLKLKKNVDLILIKVNYRDKTSRLFPENIYATINFYKIENNRFYSNKTLPPGKIFFKNSFLEENGFKIIYLKKIVKKIFFDKIKTKLLCFKYYSEL